MCWTAYTTGACMEILTERTGTLTSLATCSSTNPVVSSISLKQKSETSMDHDKTTTCSQTCGKDKFVWYFHKQSKAMDMMWPWFLA